MYQGAAVVVYSGINTCRQVMRGDKHPSDPLFFFYKVFQCVYVHTLNLIYNIIITTFNLYFINLYFISSFKIKCSCHCGLSVTFCTVEKLPWIEGKYCVLIRIQQFALTQIFPWRWKIALLITAALIIMSYDVSESQRCPELHRDLPINSPTCSANRDFRYPNCCFCSQTASNRNIVHHLVQ